jgi:GNAT superfamily N-acetyltransferase
VSGVALADYDPSIAPCEIARVWHRSWTHANPDLAQTASIEPLLARVTRELADGTWQVSVARLDGRLVAFAAVLPADGRLDQLFVVPEAQGHGVGTALLGGAMERHPQGLWLRTQAGNANALRLYARHGFVEFARRPHETMPVEMVYLRWPGAVR